MGYWCEVVCKALTGFSKSYDYLDEVTKANLGVEKDGLYLYRHILSLNVPDLVEHRIHTLVHACAHVHHRRLEQTPDSHTHTHTCTQTRNFRPSESLKLQQYPISLRMASKLIGSAAR